MCSSDMMRTGLLARCIGVAAALEECARPPDARSGVSGVLVCVGRETAQAPRGSRQLCMRPIACEEV